MGKDGERDGSRASGEEGRDVLLSTLAAMTGFPVERVKRELGLEGDRVSLGELRLRAARYLEALAAPPARPAPGGPRRRPLRSRRQRSDQGSVSTSPTEAPREESFPNRSS